MNNNSQFDDSGVTLNENFFLYGKLSPGEWNFVSCTILESFLHEETNIRSLRLFAIVRSKRVYNSMKVSSLVHIKVFPSHDKIVRETNK